MPPVFQPTPAKGRPLIPLSFVPPAANPVGFAPKKGALAPTASGGPVEATAKPVETPAEPVEARDPTKELATAVHALMAVRSGEMALQEALASCPTAEQRLEFAKTLAFDAEAADAALLVALSTFDVAAVREGVARNKHTPRATLRQLARDVNLKVAGAALRNRVLSDNEVMGFVVAPDTVLAQTAIAAALDKQVDERPKPFRREAFLAFHARGDAWPFNPLVRFEYESELGIDTGPMTDEERRFVKAELAKLLANARPH